MVILSLDAFSLAFNMDRGDDFMVMSDACLRPNDDTV